LPEQLSTLPIIVYVGRISPEKGFHLLIEAVNILKQNSIQVGVVVLGECNNNLYREKITNMMNRYEIENQFYFAGFVKRVHPWIVHADMLIVPSLIETFCLSVLDGWYAKKPVVASEVGGLPEVVTNGSNGLLFNPGNYYELSEKIKYLLTHQKDAERMGRSGYLTLKKRFAHDKMVRKTEAIYFNHNISSGSQAG
jgi:glycosyltransferase involved in cell wall biosynthesis